MSEKLADKFGLSLERIEQIKAMLRHGSVLSSCAVRADVLKKAVNTQHKTTQGDITRTLKQIGFLDDNGDMPEDVRQLTLSAFGYEDKAPDISELQGASCPYPQPSFFEE